MKRAKFKFCSIPRHYLIDWYINTEAQETSAPFSSVSGGIHTHMWNNQQALCADKAIDKTFYIPPLWCSI